MLEEILLSGFAEYSLPIDRQALDRFRLYANALEETNKVMNLTAIEGEDDIARLHFLDSAALLTLTNSYSPGCSPAMRKARLSS